MEAFRRGVRSRIVWQREKGRAAARNWKNCTEDIWFGTLSDDYVFHADAVRQKRQIIAPYRDEAGPRGWEEGREGRFRLTAAGNFWDGSILINNQRLRQQP